MKILVINAGSSSLKYQLIDMDNEQMVCKGNCERIGMPGGIFTHKTADGRELHKNVNMLDHAAAFMQVKNALIDGEYGVINSLDEVAAVGHRIVQGGSIFHESVLVDEKVIEDIESLIPLAPFTTRPTARASAPAARSSASRSPRWWCSTPLSTPPCPPRPTCSTSPMSITRSTPCAATASTAPPTAM